MPTGAFAASLADCTGVIRVFGDTSSWMSSCFVVGDGSWAVTSSDAVTERVGPKAQQTIHYPIFISPYTGQAMQCELKWADKDLSVAVLKLPVSGLPAAALAQFSEFAKAAAGTLGQLVSGDPMGNRWDSDIMGITREQASAGYKLIVNGWTAKKAFVTEMGKFQWLFVSDVDPAGPIPNGSMVARASNVVGMYVSKLTITGGGQSVTYGRCAISSEIARFLVGHGLQAATLTEPPRPTAARGEDADAAFQLEARIYSLVGARRPDLAVEPASELVKLRPSDAQAQMVLGTALTGASKFEEALKAFDAAVKLDPKLLTLKTGRALALIGLKKRDEAESELLKATEEAPYDSRPLSALADFYLGDEKTYDKALIYAKKAVSAAPDSPAALLLRARVEKRLKMYPEAAATIGEALKMAPEWGQAWFALGSTCEEAGDKAGAEKAYRALADKQPKNPDALLALASFLADQGKKDEPLELITKLRDLNPPQPVLDAAKTLEGKLTKKAE